MEAGAVWALLEVHERHRLLEEEARANEQAELRWLRERCASRKGHCRCAHLFSRPPLFPPQSASSIDTVTTQFTLKPVAVERDEMKRYSAI